MSGIGASSVVGDVGNILLLDFTFSDLLYTSFNFHMRKITSLFVDERIFIKIDLERDGDEVKLDKSFWWWRTIFCMEELS